MKANPSERWKTEIVEVVKDHDFQYVEVYDAGRRFRQNDHQCDFCGSHLRYTAVVQAEDDDSFEYGIGLDCLEHLMGTRWSRLQQVERAIKDLKKKAKQKRRVKAYQDEYSGVIQWIEDYLDIKYNSFLRDMHKILTKGTRDFTRNMEEAVKRIHKRTDLDQMKVENEQQDQDKKKFLRRTEKVLDLISEVDDIEIDDDYNRQDDSFVRDSYRYCFSVYGYIKRTGKPSEKQLKALNNIYKQYKGKLQNA